MLKESTWSCKVDDSISCFKKTSVKVLMENMNLHTNMQTLAAKTNNVIVLNCFIFIFSLVIRIFNIPNKKMEIFTQVQIPQKWITKSGSKKEKHLGCSFNLTTFNKKHHVPLMSLRPTLAHRCSEGTEAAGKGLRGSAALPPKGGCIWGETSQGTHPAASQGQLVKADCSLI